MKKLLLIMILFALTAHASEHRNEMPAFQVLNQNYFIEVIASITPLTATKKVFIQDNKIKTSAQLNSTRMFCYFENIRTQDASLKKTISSQIIFKISDDFNDSWEKYLGYRIWQKGLLFWDNGYYQFFSCESSEDDMTLTSLKQHVGKFLKFRK